MSRRRAGSRARTAAAAAGGAQPGGRAARRGDRAIAENRAIDWHLSVHSAADRRAAAKLILLLLAPDRAGNPQALARRMGVEELIWDCGYWSIGMADFEPYSVCYDRKGKRLRGVDDTTAHRDHVHIGMTKAGARGRTSFWQAR